MIVKSFPLIRPGVFAADYRSIDLDPSKILVKPDFLSICAADQRYYLGLRPASVLKKKLPMVLIHEAVGTVVFSTKDNFEIGSKVVLLPCGVNASVDTNYEPNAYFRSSNADGFCQELIAVEEEELIKISDQNDELSFVFSELLSVSFQGVRQINSEIQNSNSIAIWGDGNLGYLLSFVLSEEYPEKDITVIGKHEDKMEKFNFVDHVETVYTKTNKCFDLMIECVGGNGAQNAIDDMIECANPKATILLTGVSENPPMINTRRILLKERPDLSETTS